MLITFHGLTLDVFFMIKARVLKLSLELDPCAYVAGAKPSFMGQDLCDDCPLCQHSAGPRPIPELF